MSYGKAQSKGIKSDIRSIANIRHLTRIITYLSEVETDSITNISKKTGINIYYVKSALVFLVNHGIVIKGKDLRRKPNKRWGTIWYYKLNHKGQRLNEIK